MTRRDSAVESDPAVRGADGGSFRHGATMNDLFASCARRYPGATAVVHGASSLTYAELDALSEHYAVALEQAGVGPGDFVPVVMKRSPELVAMLLAVLKRGAAYSALDPGWPSARLTRLAVRLRAGLVVTDVDGPWPVRAWMPPTRDAAVPARRASPVQVGPDDPFTVLFTSGSSGEPKGVICTHRSTVRLYDDCEWIPVGPGVCMPQVAAVSWDGLVIDCWGPLLTGGTTVLVDQRILTPAAVSELHDRHGVNTMYLTPTLFNVLVDEGVECFAGIAAVVTGGEKASPRHSRRFLTSHPGARLVNIYGPSECGVLVSAHDVTLPDCDAADGIPLGRELPQSGIHILELDGTAVCGERQVGEICLAGAGLAIGYLDDPELTARQFTDVQIGGTRTRVYRSGDLGHWAHGHMLCWDGRADRQLKLHGYRIEPEEIELTAARVTGVSMTAVVPLWRDGLVEALALFYSSPEVQVSEADLRAELSRQLPDYLVPRRIARLDRFPLTANNKLDRPLLEAILSAAQPAAPADGETHAAEPAAPPADDASTATEATVSAIFAEILGTPTVPHTASFFDLGGDSLSVARVCARLEQATGDRVQVSQVFRTPTVAGLARWLDSARAAAPQRAAHDGTRPAEPAVIGRADGRLVRLTPMQAAVVATQIVSDFGWWLDGAVDEDALERAAGDVHRRHQGLHARYPISGPDLGWALVPADPGRPRFHRLPAARTDAAVIDAVSDVLTRHFQLDRGEVWRCALARSTQSGRRLLGMVAHHAAFDGRSATVLTEDLATAYAARVAGNEPRWAAPAASLADFDAEYHRQLAATDLDVQREYWRGEFDGLAPCRLPGRGQGPVPPEGPVVAPTFEVGSAQLQAWEEYGRRTGMTAFVWVAAVYAQALIDAGGPHDIGLMCPIANRGGSELIARSITNRMGAACLRPNSPTRNGPHLLARMHDAYSNAMAATDLLLDNEEVARVVGGPTGGYILLGTPYLLYQDVPLPTVKLGDVTGTLEPKFGGWVSSGVDMCLEVLVGSAAGITLHMAMRTDLYPATLAENIGKLFLEIIADGPLRLEQRTAAGR